MGKNGVVVFGLLTPLSLLVACGEVTTNEDAGLCAPAGCDDVDAGTRQALPRRPGQKGIGMTDLRTRSAPAPTEVIMLPCTVCARAEACCRAQGLTDCNYAVACATATASEQSQFYLVLCRAVLEAAADGFKKPPDTCGF
jgi:hypothetical protein